MVGHMTSMFNIAAGVVGAIVGGAVGTSWAMTQFWIHRTTVDVAVYRIKEGTEYSQQRFSQLNEGQRVVLDAYGELEQVYDWVLIAPTSAAAALVGAFVVLLGVGILRKVYETK